MIVGTKNVTISSDVHPLSLGLSVLWESNLGSPVTIDVMYCAVLITTGTLPVPIMVTWK
jgi:hypothetical protein